MTSRHKQAAQVESVMQSKVITTEFLIAKSLDSDLDGRQGRLDESRSINLLSPKSVPHLPEKLANNDLGKVANEENCL